jgi:phosphatidate cytidylyltransferase
MTPWAALESEIFRTYAAIVASLLLIAGVAIGLARWRYGPALDHAIQSFRSWLLMAPAVLAALFLGREAFILFVIALALCGFWEFARATGLARDRWLTAVAGLGIVALGITALMRDPVSQNPGWYGGYMVSPVYAIAAILLVPIVRNRAAGQLQQLSMAVLGFVYIGWMFGHLAFLANSRRAYGYLMYLLLAVELNDIAAYVCGRLLGKHPLRSEISPKKTFSFPHFRPLELVLTGLIVGIGGQVGDLTLSVIKRDVAIKDMGDVIPGHGGILDRIDSLIYVSPLFFHMVRSFHEF